jgi:hypothetical protein
VPLPPLEPLLSLLGDLVPLLPPEPLPSLGDLVSLEPLSLDLVPLPPLEPLLSLLGDSVPLLPELLPSAGLLLLALLGSGLNHGVLGDASGLEAGCTAGCRTCSAAGCRSCTAGCRSCTAGCRSSAAGCRTCSAAGCRSCTAGCRSCAAGCRSSAAGCRRPFETSGRGAPKIALELKPSATRAIPRALSHCHGPSLGIGHPPPPPLPLPCGPEVPPGPPKNRSRLCRVTAAPAQSPSDSLIRSASERFVRAIIEESSRHSAWVPD